MERMLEDHLYWAIVHARWAIDANFEKGPAQFFAGAPDDVKRAGQDNVKRTLFGQGFGRHDVAEIANLASRDFASASALLGDKPFLFGDAPCSKDATLFAFTAAAATPFFDTSIRQAAERYPNLVSLQWRMMDRYYEPAMAELRLRRPDRRGIAAGCPRSAASWLSRLRGSGRRAQSPPGQPASRRAPAPRRAPRRCG